MIVSFGILFWNLIFEVSSEYVSFKRGITLVGIPQITMP
jgi:hypothetical protein